MLNSKSVLRRFAEGESVVISTSKTSLVSKFPSDPPKTKMRPSSVLVQLVAARFGKFCTFSYDQVPRLGL